MTPKILALKIIAGGIMFFFGTCATWATIFIGQGQFALGMLCLLLGPAALILLGFLFEEVTMRIIELRLTPLPQKYQKLYLWMSWPYYFLIIS